MLPQYFRILSFPAFTISLTPLVIPSASLVPYPDTGGESIIKFLTSCTLVTLSGAKGLRVVWGIIEFPTPRFIQSLRSFRMTETRLVTNTP